MSVDQVSFATVNSQLRHWSLTDPATTAFIFRSADPNTPRLTLTRREVFTLASRYAATLRRKGIQRGDIVCNILPNSPERLVTDLGIVMAGAATLNGMALMADGADFHGSLRATGCVAIVSDPRHDQNPMTTLRKLLVFNNNGVVECPQAPALKQLLEVDCGLDGDGHKPFLENLKRVEEEEYVANVQSSDNAFIFATSGSTGFSKLVPYTHAMFLKFGQAFFDDAIMQGDDILFNDRCLGWAVGSPSVYIRKGVTRVLTDQSTNISADHLALAWLTIKEECCTSAFFVPQHIDMSLARRGLWEPLNPRLRVLITGGQPVMKQHTEVVDRMTGRLTIIYGATETGTMTVRQVQSCDKEYFLEGDNGLAVDGYQLKIVDEDLKEIQEADKMGEILVRGDSIFSGYLGAEHNQQEFFTRDGWFRTTDVGYRDSQGHLHVVCRKSHGIIHGDFVVYPGWLETRIARCPGVQNIIVVPIPDPSIYQELCACVVPRPGAKITGSDVKEFCKSVFLVPVLTEITAIPRYYVFFDSFPTTGTGKTDRKTIRAAALEKLGMPSAVFLHATDELMEVKAI